MKYSAHSPKHCCHQDLTLLNVDEARAVHSFLRSYLLCGFSAMENNVWNNSLSSFIMHHLGLELRESPSQTHPVDAEWQRHVLNWQNHIQKQAGFIDPGAFDLQVIQSMLESI